MHGWTIAEVNGVVVGRKLAYWTPHFLETSQHFPHEHGDSTAREHMNNNLDSLILSLTNTCPRLSVER